MVIFFFTWVPTCGYVPVTVNYTCFFLLSSFITYFGHLFFFVKVTKIPSLCCVIFISMSSGYFKRKTSKASKLTICLFSAPSIEHNAGAEKLELKQTNVSFEAFLVGNQG